MQPIIKIGRSVDILNYNTLKVIVQNLSLYGDFNFHRCDKRVNAKYSS